MATQFPYQFGRRIPGLTATLLRNVTFRSSVAVNPGILRPNWYGNCVATYGLRSVVFEGVVVRGWSFEDLDGTAYTPVEGTMGDPGLSGKKVWSRSDGGVVAPFFLPSRTQRVNVVIE